MNKFFKLSFAAIAAIYSVLACADNIYTEDKPNINITSKQPEFVLKLKSNPTTGYSWFLREYDANLISPIKHSFQAANNGLVGSSGFDFWTFKVKPAGFTVPQQTVIRMVYARPWATSDNPTQVVFRISTTK